MTKRIGRFENLVRRTTSCVAFITVMLLLAGCVKHVDQTTNTVRGWLGLGPEVGTTVAQQVPPPEPASLLSATTSEIVARYNGQTLRFSAPAGYRLTWQPAEPSGHPGVGMVHEPSQIRTSINVFRSPPSAGQMYSTLQTLSLQQVAEGLRSIGSPLNQVDQREVDGRGVHLYGRNISSTPVRSGMRLTQGYTVNSLTEGYPPKDLTEQHMRNVMKTGLMIVSVQ
ncbi:MAG: hypothetical protein AAF220_09680 [Pseudomonadota bacterium]